MKAILIPTDGDPSIVEHDGTFRSIYPLLGCTIVEYINRSQWVEPGHKMLVDEEGTFVDPPNVNPNASLIVGNFVYGHAIIVADSGTDIIEMDAPEAYLQRYKQVVEGCRRRRPSVAASLDAMADAYRTVWSEPETSS
jgi:hypothetical protein